jgi:hypothetical protein
VNRSHGVQLTPHVKVPRSIPDVADLLVLVQVLLKEAFDLGFIGVAETGPADIDLVPDWEVDFSGLVPVTDRE